MKLFREEFKENPKSEKNLEQKLINLLIWDGKKSHAQKIVKGAHYFLIKKESLNNNKLKRNKRNKPKEFTQLLLKAVIHGSPSITIRSRRRGSQRLRVPFPLRKDQRYSIGLRWIVIETRRKATMKKYIRKFDHKEFEKHTLIGYMLGVTVWQTALGKGEVVERVKTLGKEVNKSRGNSYLRWLFP